MSDQKTKKTVTKIKGVHVSKTAVYDGVQRAEYLFGFAAKANLGAAWSNKHTACVYAARERGGKIERNEWSRNEFESGKRGAFKAALEWCAEDSENATNTTGEI